MLFYTALSDEDFKFKRVRLWETRNWLKRLICLISALYCERVIPTRNEDTQSQNLICLYTSSTDLLQSETRSKEQHKDN
jgi:hypothetical protein